MRMMKDIYLMLPMLLCVILLMMPSWVLAAPTYGVAVPMKASKQTLLYQNPNVLKKHAPIVGQTYSTSATRGVRYRSLPAKGLYNVSAGTVQSYGGASQYTVSSQGGVVSVMPTHVQSTTFSISQVSVSPRRVGSGTSSLATTNGLVKRRIYSPDAPTDGNGKYWDEEVNDWVDIPNTSTPSVGDTRINPDTGLPEIWNGSGWVLAPTEPAVPVGDVPFVLLAALLAGYVVHRQLRRRGVRGS